MRDKVSCERAVWTVWTGKTGCHQDLGRMRYRTETKHNSQLYLTCCCFITKPVNTIAPSARSSTMARCRCTEAQHGKVNTGPVLGSPAAEHESGHHWSELPARVQATANCQSRKRVQLFAGERSSIKIMLKCREIWTQIQHLDCYPYKPYIRLRKTVDYIGL